MKPGNLTAEPMLLITILNYENFMKIYLLAVYWIDFKFFSKRKRKISIYHYYLRLVTHKILVSVKHIKKNAICPL